MKNINLDWPVNCKEEMMRVSKNSKNAQYQAVVFLFHGTNETCYDTDLLNNTESDKAGHYPWFDLSMCCNMLLVLCQSRYARHKEKVERRKDSVERRKRELGLREDGYRCLWLPGEEDLEYVRAVKEDIVTKYLMKKVGNGKKKKVKFYGVGYSNGGVFWSGVFCKVSVSLFIYGSESLCSGRV